jgi:TolB-like protein/tetratricopeptide (TPR) repeat protein
MAGEIFISYRRADQAWAQLLHSQLRAEGIEAWYDAQVGAGQDWRISTAKALQASRIFVLLFSSNAAQSTDIAKELAAAVFEKKLIIPVRLEDIAPDGAFLYELASRNWVNAYEDTEAKLAQLAKGLAHLVRTGARDESVLPFDRGGGQTPAQTRKRTYASALIAAAAVLVIAVSGIAAWLLWRSPHPAAEAESAKTTAPASAVPVKPESTEPAFNPPPHSVAVLPFVNMSGDPKEDYFSDGISEELLNALSSLNDLQVVARTSSFSFKGQNVDMATIAHKLNVGAVLEGSVRRSGNTVRITAQLINTVTGFHLWSETYDRPFNDIFKVQTEVATAVAQQLEIKLAGSESAKIEVGGTKNPGAYDAYLRAQRVHQEGEGEPGDRATVVAVDKAIALDPDYAAAYVLRSNALRSLWTIANVDTVKGLGDQAIASAERAVALAPDYGDAHAALGRVREDISVDFVVAGAEFDRALVLAPGSAYVQSTFGTYAALIGHFEPALTAMRRAVSLDRENWRLYFSQGQTFFLARQYGAAVAAFQHGLALRPGALLIDAWLGWTFFLMGQTEQARQLCEAPATAMHEDDRHECLALVYHALGRQTDAEHELNQFKKLDGDAGAFHYANIYAQWGNAPAALQWLNKVERLRLNGLEPLKVDPMLDPIRNEPQFEALLARMKFPP